MPDSLLEVDDLHVEFRTDEGRVHAVNGISLAIAPGETLGIVGESGSGKSVTSLALLGLIPQPPGKVTRGSARFRGRDLLKMRERELADIRGNRIAMIFQDPMTSLNPFLTIAEQLTEVTRLHLGYPRRKSLDHAVEMLEQVGIPDPGRRIFEYPHQFSGGMRQRVMIAIALSCKPDLLIADEPTTALDVTIQAQILELIRSLQASYGAAVILITHDLGVVAQVCDRVNVMYAGRFVEEAPVERLFADPRHPYTIGLLGSRPRIHGAAGRRLTPIAGQPPHLAHLDQGCAFRPRCAYAFERCAAETPPLVEIDVAGRAACFADVRLGVPATAIAPTGASRG